MSLFKNKYKVILLAALIGLAALLVFNLDVVLRFARAYQSGTLTMQKIRYDLASFDFGKKSLVTPLDEKVSATDGMRQVYVPAGEFLMGKKNARGTSAPQHVVYLDAFWIDRVEVSNAMYLKCLKAGACTPLASNNIYYQNWIYRDHPVIYVTWEQAGAYCQWAGRDLPTEAQWEKAARGTDGRLYPWGSKEPNPSLANYAGSMIHEDVSVYRYPLGASPYGALNMSGNAREWIQDWFDPEYYNYSPYANPTGPATGLERSLRSGSYNEDGREVIITKRYNHDPSSAGLSRGFRCAEN
ncbi:MAG: SUMF1/EgtB/PvdO family nonheme iron enzyme [Anaerolineales bacterium]|nr:SUMF1/EgtB/PvdO family nonheme iron enzyme [Anaerolineales bacterium]